MGDRLATPDQLELAVAGLAGILGALVLPTVAVWIRLLLQWLESGYAALGRNPRVSGRRVLAALLLTLVFVFTLFCLGRAASELREVRVEAPVLAKIVLSALAGFSLCAGYTLAWRAFRRDLRRRRQFLR